MFQVLISPGTVGIDGFVLQLMSGNGKKLPAKEATLYLSLPERGIEPLKRKATLGSDGYWHVPDVRSLSRRWHVRIDARTDFQQITLEDDLTSRRAHRVSEGPSRFRSTPLRPNGDGETDQQNDRNPFA